MKQNKCTHKYKTKHTCNLVSLVIRTGAQKRGRHEIKNRGAKLHRRHNRCLCIDFRVATRSEQLKSTRNTSHSRSQKQSLYSEDSSLSSQPHTTPTRQPPTTLTNKPTDNDRALPCQQPPQHPLNSKHACLIVTSPVVG